MTIAADLHPFDESRSRRSCRAASRSRPPSLCRRRPAYARRVPAQIRNSRAGHRLLLWRRLASGSKRTYRYVAKALARRGYVAVLPDYRIYPQARYPDFLDDGALAVRWVKDNAKRFGGDPQKIFLMGHSAGAHIAAMLAIDATWLQKVGLVPGRDIAGLIGVSGPYDFLPLKDETLKIIFGGADRPGRSRSPTSRPARRRRCC